MKKWLLILLVYVTPLVLITKAMLSTGSMTDIVLLILGLIWLSLVVTFKLQQRATRASNKSTDCISYQNNRVSHHVVHHDNDNFSDGGFGGD